MLHQHVNPHWVLSGDGISRNRHTVADSLQHYFDPGHIHMYAEYSYGS